MESVDRVRAALALERPDRPPAGWWGHTYQDEWFARDLAGVTVRRQREHAWDYVKLQPRACCFAQAFGAEYRPAVEFRDAPAPARPVVSEPGDWDRIPAVGASAPSLREQVDALRLVVGQLGPSVPVIQTLFSPLTVAGYLMGEDKPGAARTLRERPDAVSPALERIGDTLAEFAAESVAAGAAGVFYAISGYASADLMSGEDYERLALPHDRRVMEALPEAAWCNVLHLCGARVHFDLASELPAHAVSWSIHEAGNPPLAEGRDRAGRAAMGGLDHTRTMVEGTPAVVLAQRAAAVESTGGRGVLVAPGCSVPPEAPEPNLRAVTRLEPPG
ncbi:MAG: uroporphyrinogen decarboxylase family protein [Actinomycetota bacterium]